MAILRTRKLPVQCTPFTALRIPSTALRFYPRESNLRAYSLPLVVADLATIVALLCDDRPSLADIRKCAIAGEQPAEPWIGYHKVEHFFHQPTLEVRAEHGVGLRDCGLHQLGKISVPARE